MFHGIPGPFEAICATIANGFLKQLLEFEVQLRYFDGNMTAIAEDYANNVTTSKPRKYSSLAE